MRYYILFSLFILLNLKGFAIERIQGVVQDKVSRHTLSGANVQFMKIKIGTVTDSYGRFEITPSPVANDTLLMTFMGYKAKRIPVSELLVGDKVNYIELKRTILILDELRVEADRYKSEIRSLKMEPGSIRLDFQDIRTVPYSIYPDVNRSLQFLPGVISTNDLTSELNVRGGSPDQNLVLLEGVPVYYPFHVFGIASAFNADMVGEVHFSPGGFSAQYGNRLSSVLNIKAHSPQKKLEMSADLSLLGADVTASGRWKSKFDWIVSFRKSYYDILLKKLGDGVPYAFHDIFSKLSYKPNQNNTFSVLYFDFRDRFTEVHQDQERLYYSPENPDDYITYKWDYEGNFSWKNRLWCLSWDHRFHNKLSIQAKLYRSLAGNVFDTNKQTSFPDDFPSKYGPLIKQILEQDRMNKVKVDNDFTDQSALLSFNWDPSPSLTFLGGIQRTQFQTNYGWGNNQLPFTPLYNYQEHIRLYFDNAPDYFNYKQNFMVTAGYGEMLWDIKEKYHLRAGLRATKWSPLQKILLAPRLNLKYNLCKDLSVKAAYGYFSQGLATSLEQGLVNFLPLFFPVNDSLKLETAKQYIFSLDYNSGKSLQVSLTSFLKNYNNLIKSVGPHPDFIQIHGKAYGLEFLAKGCLWGWKTWLAATISRTYRTINGIQYDTNWDQRYRFDLFASKNIGKSWSFSWAWVLYSGVPYIADYYVAAVRHVDWSKPLDQQDQDLYDTILIDVPPGKIRFPWYHRLDISFEKEFHFSTWHLDVYFSVRNLYARRNVLYYTEPGSLSYDTKNGKYVDYYIKHPFTWLPPIPTVGLRFII